MNSHPYGNGYGHYPPSHQREGSNRSYGTHPQNYHHINHRGYQGEMHSHSDGNHRASSVQSHLHGPPSFENPLQRGSWEGSSRHSGHHIPFQPCHYHHCPLELTKSFQLQWTRTKRIWQESKNEQLQWQSSMEGI